VERVGGGRKEVKRREMYLLLIDEEAEGYTSKKT
jgi:hypothetical protein